jgi:phosphopantothenoylcysteine decarboxylase/phosphopantothenate--cysteine ligase
VQPHLAFNGFLGKRLHLGVTGSVAICKAPELVRMWAGAGVSVSATLTKAAREFITPLTFQALGAAPVYTEMFSHKEGGAGGSEEALFGHLEPGQRAEAMVVAPATANMLGKLANGLADDMLSCQALAFPGTLVIAPAMNPRLWSAQATQENCGTLRRRGHLVLEPEEGVFACGDEGKGRLPRLEHIYLEGLRKLAPQDMEGQKVLVTLGPTREYWDPIRFWSNPSSGLMGGAMALSAWLRGAEVSAVCGPCDLWLPPGVNRYDVVNAHDMFRACSDLWDSMDIGCFTAAVADFSPWHFGDEKFKKQSAVDGLTVEFTANDDILKTLSVGRRSGQRIIGFAAETSGTVEEARRKLAAKRADIFVANTIGRAESGFGTATNEVCVIDAQGREERWPVLPKTEVAWRVWDWLLHL